MKRYRFKPWVIAGLELALAFVLFAGLGLHTSPRQALGASFTPGDLVVYRVGDGSAGLVNTGAAVFLDEYTPSGTLVQSIALPTTNNGNNKPLIASGTASSEGLLSRSADGRYLALTGYGTTLGGGLSLSGTFANSVPRTVGLVDSAGTIDTSTALTDFADQNNPRSVVTSNGTDLWVGGAAGGVRYSTVGSTSSTQLATTPANIQQVNIFNGQLYASSASGTNTFKGVSTIGTGLPTTAGQTATRLPGLTDTTDPADSSYYFADLSTAVPGLDTLYIADSSQGISKFSLVSGSWVLNGTVGAGSDTYRGLTGLTIGSSVTLYATGAGGTGAAGGGKLVTYTDGNGYNVAPSGSPTTIATAATNTAFRGVAFTPQNPPQANPDSYNATAGTPLGITQTQGVLANDTNGPLTVVNHSNPAHGTLNLSADGSFTYTAQPSFVGTDTFTYTVSNGVQLYRTHIAPLGVFSGTAVTAGGYGSSLYPVPGSTTNEYYGLTDRGPNVDGPGGTKIEPIPTFQPAIGKFRFLNGQAILEQIIGLAAADGSPYSGRVNSQASTGETITDLNGNVLATDPNGYDSEGLVALPDGTFWVSDEYGPFITHFDATGKQIGRLSPGNGIPAELAKRVINRGMEGLTITPDGTTLVGMMQSALQQGDIGSTDPKKIAPVRFITYNLNTQAVHEYLYLLDNPGSNKTANSEITALTNTTFLVDERDGNYPPGSYKKLWRIDLTGVTDIGPSSTVSGTTYSASGGGLLISGKTIEATVLTQNTATATATLASANITPASKSLYLDVDALLTGFDPAGRLFSHDKLEGVAVANNGSQVIISNDSDFGIDGVTNATPPYQLHAKVSPTTGQQDDGEYLLVDFNRLSEPTSTATVTINVSPGPASVITAVAGNNQSTPISTTFATALSAKVTDANNNPISGEVVTFTAPISGASGTFGNASNIYIAATDASGIVTTTAFTANSVAGSYAVTANFGSVATASFNLTNTVGAAANFITTGGGQSATVNTAFSQPLSVKLTDAGSNPIISTVVTFTAPVSGASGTFTNSSNVYVGTTDASGTVTTSIFTANNITGTYGVAISVANSAINGSIQLTNVAACDPLQVTSTVDGTGCGTLRGALTAAVLQGSSPVTVTLNLAPGSVISMTTGITLTDGVNLVSAASCGNGAPIVLQGVGANSGVGLTAAKNNFIQNIWIRGFSGTQLLAPTGSHAVLKCVKASKS